MRALNGRPLLGRLRLVPIPARESIMTRTGLLAAAILALPTSTFANDKVEEARQARAELQCRSLLQACEAYVVNPANKTRTYPTILLELVKPPFGGPSFIRDGEKDLIDPWGKMFQYAVAKDEKGNLRAYVWTERTVDGKTKVIGRKPPEPKKKP
jgi:hypothetical protein